MVKSPKGDNVTPRPGIAATAGFADNAFQSGKKKRARPLDAPSGTAHSGDQTATTLCLALPWTGSCLAGLSEGTGNSVLATLRIRVGDCLHGSASSDVAYFGATDPSPNRVVR